MMKKQCLQSLKLNKKVISEINQFGGIEGKPPSKELPNTLHCNPITQVDIMTLCHYHGPTVVICN